MILIEGVAGGPGVYHDAGACLINGVFGDRIIVSGDESGSASIVQHNRWSGSGAADLISNFVGVLLQIYKAPSGGDAGLMPRTWFEVTVVFVSSASPLYGLGEESSLVTTIASSASAMMLSEIFVP